MRILRLDLLAFGPFTQQRLALDEGKHGLHMVYGPNEAGKTSTLRALRCFLYGFPHVTADNFQHANDGLRVGAVLHDGNGTRLECIRRKGRKNTLRAPDDSQIIDDSALAKLLAGVSEESFCRQFGIRHADLVRGGKEIVAGGGEIGQILFAAASGFAELNDVRRKLAEEAESLFTPTATVKPINKAITEFKAQRKAAKEAQLSSSAWKKHRDALSDAELQKKELEERQREIGADLARLERIGRALPGISRRREVLDEIEKLGDVPLLGADYSDRRRRAELERTKVEAQERAAADAIDDLTRKLDGVQVREAVLAHSDAIAALKGELAIHQKAAQDSRDRTREREQLLSDAEEILREIGRSDVSIESAQQLRLSKEERLRIQRLGAEYGKRVEREEQARNLAEELERSLAEMESELERLPPPRDAGPLAQALARLHKQGDLAARLAEMEHEQRLAEQQAKVDLQKLPLWRGTLEELESLAAPSAETIGEFENRLEQSRQKCEKLDSKYEQTRDQLAGLDEKLHQLDLQHDVPTESDLDAARALREKGWRQVRAALRGDAAPDAAEFLAQFGAGSLEEGYEECVEHADEVADRLRREAERVGEKSHLLAQRAKEEQRLEQLTTQRGAAQAAHDTHQDEWRGQWRQAGIDPLSPREMRAWLAQQRELAESARSLRRRADELAHLRRRIDEHRRELLARLGELNVALQNDDPPLDGLVAICEETLRAAEQVNANHERLESDAARQRRQLQDAAKDARREREKLEAWRVEWSGATERLRLQDADPTVAGAVLDEITRFFAKLGDAEQLTKRITDMTNDMDDVAGRVKSICQELAPNLLNSPFEAVGELHRQWQAANEASARRAELKNQLAAARQKLDGAQDRRGAVDAELSSLCKEAGCSLPEELAPVEQKSNCLRDLQRRLEEVESNLRQEAAGRPLPEFIESALAEDADHLPGEIAQLKQDLEETNEKWGDVRDLIGAERNELSKMDGNARAAEAQEEAEQLLTQLRNDGERYVRLRLAAEVLRGAIQRHRERNQGPVVQRASELFRQLTLGAFAGLLVDYDEEGQARLVGVRENGKTVPVEGMSDGSCDQLYLALRLASLEHYLESHPPLPFIVDDILITFDDDRAAAALEALAELSRRTQVIFFTHHARLVELAKGRLPKRVVCVHELPSPLASVEGKVDSAPSGRTLFV